MVDASPSPAPDAMRDDDLDEDERVGEALLARLREQVREKGDVDHELIKEVIADYRRRQEEIEAEEAENEQRALNIQKTYAELHRQYEEACEEAEEEGEEDGGGVEDERDEFRENMKEVYAQLQEAVEELGQCAEEQEQQAQVAEQAAAEKGGLKGLPPPGQGTVTGTGGTTPASLRQSDAMLDDTPVRFAPR